MSNWLADYAAPIYMFLGAAGVIFGVAWWQTKRGWLAVGAGAIIVLLGLFFLLRTFYPSDAELIFADIEEMAAAVQSRNLDRLFRPLADNFTFRGRNRSEFRRIAETILQNRNVTEVRVWGFQSENVSRKDGTARISFQFKPKGNWGESGAFYLCEAEFVLERDGKWRLRTFEVFPAVGEKRPISIPDF
jgi:hypothetical protein